MYVVLIGSVARNEENSNSDIDICRVESDINVERINEWPRGPINYIDYSYADFNKLYKKGSLFIYHVINEGVLIHGNKDKWQELKDEFVFIDDYDEEINNIKEILEEFLDIGIYGNSFLTLYSNLYTLIKNLAIYSLAQKDIFEFNKEKAVVNVFGHKYYNLLCEAYNIFERSCIKPTQNYNFSCETLASKVITYYRNKLEVL